MATSAARAEDSRGSAPYLSVGPLAEGGMGSVELVLRREGSFERLYARKRPKEEYRRDPEFRRAFLDEARLAGLLRHPNVVSVLDVGEDADGPYLIMDLVDGFSLATIISQFRARDDLLPLSVCVAICKQMAEGLHAAHELVDHAGRPQPLVHRDISPQNALVDHEGVARVTDFGLAKALGQSSDTSSEVLRGKLGYMSPEQLRFQRLDRRSDLFSLGVVLYETITTERLYRASTIEEAAQRILNEAPPDPTEIRQDVPPSLVALLMDLLCKDPNTRPKDAATVARELAKIGREIAETEEPLELRDFMIEHFGEEHDAVRAVRARAVEAVLNGRKAALVPRREIGEATAKAKPSVIDTRPWVAAQLDPSADVPGSAKSSGGEWGPGDSHATRRGGAAPLERTVGSARKNRWFYAAAALLLIAAVAIACYVVFDRPPPEPAAPAVFAPQYARTPEEPVAPRAIAPPVVERVEVPDEADPAVNTDEPLREAEEPRVDRDVARPRANRRGPREPAPVEAAMTDPRQRSALEKRLWRWP